MGLKEWWLKLKVIAAGSVDQAIEERHYSQAVRLHKLALESLLRYKSEKEIPVLPTGVYKKITELRLHPSHTTIQNVISMPEQPTWKEKLLKNSGTMRKWVVDYIQDVSSLLSQITTYRGKNIRLHLQAHSDLLPLLFAFNQQNYA